MVSLAPAPRPQAPGAGHVGTPDPSRSIQAAPEDTTWPQRPAWGSERGPRPPRRLSEEASRNRDKVSPAGTCGAGRVARVPGRSRARLPNSLAVRAAPGDPERQGVRGTRGSPGKLTSPPWGRRLGFASGEARSRGPTLSPSFSFRGRGGGWRGGAEHPDRAVHAEGQGRAGRGGRGVCARGRAAVPVPASAGRRRTCA